MEWITTRVILERLLASALVAGAIGFERERSGRAAGFQTPIRDLDIRESDVAGRVQLEFQVERLPDQPRDDIVEKLLRLDGVAAARWV